MVDKIPQNNFHDSGSRFSLVTGGVEWTLHYTVDLENFGVKKLRKAQTSTKLKHARFFYYVNFTFE